MRMNLHREEGQRKAALYIRVSTMYQIDKESLPHQREELTRYAEYALHISDYEIFEDAGFSGKNTDRPAYQEMMARIRQHEFTHLIVDKIDRISRNLLDFAAMYDELKKLDVTFISRNEQFDTSSAMGEAMLKIILVFAELERHMTSERVSAIMVDRAKKGKWNGANIPLGYDWSEKADYPVENPQEVKIVQMMFDMYEKGYSCNKLTQYLNDHGIRGKRNGLWTTASIRQVLTNPFYKGTLRYNYRHKARGCIKKESEWIVIEHNHPNIISEEQWEHVNQILKSHSVTRIRKKHDHAFSGLLACLCGATGGARLDKPRQNGVRPSYYECNTHWRVSKTLCDNNLAVSDMMIGTFVFTYLKNMIRIQQHMDEATTPEAMEAELLKGDCFRDVSGMEKASLQKIYAVFCKNSNVAYQEEEPLRYDDPAVIAGNQVKELEKKRQSHERALERLNKAYLYAEIGLSEKEYLQNRQEIMQAIQDIDQKIQVIQPNSSSEDDIAFLEASSNFIIKQELLSDAPIQWMDFALHVSAATIHQFLCAIVTKIVFYQRRILSIEFKNGVVHRFLYRE